MKRIACILLSLVLLCTLLPWQAMADDGVASTGGKLIAITFDDGPSQYTKELLDGLERLGAKATFFVLGNRVSTYSETVRRAYQAGHEIGCHSYDHSELTALSDSQVKEQFTKSYAQLDKICGSGTEYLTRAPYGSTSTRVRNLVGTPFIYWSVDPRDWDTRDTTKVYNAIVNNAADGAIVLVHDIYSTSVKGALQAIETLQKQGYAFVTVSELFRRRGVALEDTVSYSRCSPTGKDLGPVESPKITYTADQKGILATITAQTGAEIYCSLDGSSFNQESKRYTGPFYVEAGKTVYAIAAWDLNGSRSAVVSKKAEKQSCKAPTIQISGGTMTLSSPTAGAAVFYTTSGKKATTGSTRYTGAVSLAKGTVVSAVAGGGGFATSGETRRYYSKLGNVFADVFPENWYCDPLDQAVSQKILYGVGGDYYQPNAAITRAQILAVLYRMAGEPVPEGKTPYPFPDAPRSAYYGGALQWAYENGIIHGYSDGTFRPGKAVSRQEICLILDAYAVLNGTPLPDGNGAAERFADSDQIGDCFRESVDSMVAAGLMLGDSYGNLRPRSSATRAEGVALLLRLQTYAANYVPPEPEPADPEPTEPEPTVPEPAEDTT